MNEEKEPKIVRITWLDSYSGGDGWIRLTEHTPAPLRVTSIGYLVAETENTYSVSHSYAEETEETAEQAFGLIVIPKVAVTSFCHLHASLFEREQKLLWT